MKKESADFTGNPDSRADVRSCWHRKHFLCIPVILSSESIWMERLPAACMKQSSERMYGQRKSYFSPAYREDEFEEVLESCEHLRV